MSNYNQSKSLDYNYLINLNNAQNNSEKKTSIKINRNLLATI